MKITKEGLFSEIISLIESNKNEHPVIIAIDGRSASGKTTFTDRFLSIDGITVIHTDDFYRPKNAFGELEIREHDGNFDIERFKAEVVARLKDKELCYGVFDCRQQKISYYVSVVAQKCIIVEGAYSLNPRLGDYADLSVFFDIDKDMQKKRIYDRNGDENYEIFERLWIQAEERYIKHYRIEKLTDYTVTEEYDGNI